MKLKNRFILWSFALLTGVLLLGSVSIWNLLEQRREARAALAEYDAMDRADATVVQVAWLRDVLRGANSRTYRDLKFFGPLQKEITQIVHELQLAESVSDSDGSAELQRGRAAADHLDAAIRHASSAAADASAEQSSAGAAANELEQARQSLLAVSQLVPGSARHHITGAADRLLHRLEWTCVWLLVVLMISLLIHVTQYRALVRPLVWLRDDMRRSAARNYRDDVTARGGDGEFREVAAFFNGLARELADLYKGMEEKIITRSRELVRSERLASVGFLAAGVAHEINNPLSVISGYAELACKALRRVLSGGDHAASDAQAEAEAEALSAALDAQGVIHDEAFRCKEITSRLLSLARGGGDGRETLRLDEVARQVTVLTRGLKNYRDRRVVLDLAPEQPLEVFANATEMKQVLLNLTVNALEAVPPQQGEVRIAGRRAGEWVELSVQDNGTGMTAQTLENVFEPFFTAKRGAGEPGTGLGLSITHAIIENHGGRICAESNGPGHGSRFIVRLPARSSKSMTATPLLTAAAPASASAVQA